MQITRVKIEPSDDEDVAAYASITIDDCFAIHGLVLKVNKTGDYSLHMPQKKRANGTHVDMVLPLDNGSSSYDRERDCPQRNCIVEAISWYLTVLGSKDSPLAEKQVVLDYLVHLVGDLHEPLHVGFLDDGGGTKTKVTFEGKAQNLHQLWDDGILATEPGSAQAMAKALDEELSADDRAAWQAGTPTDWANESLALTIEYVYPIPESHEIGEDYVKRAMPILHRRLVQAGVRLAWLLNDALK